MAAAPPPGCDIGGTFGTAFGAAATFSIAAAVAGSLLAVGRAVRVSPAVANMSLGGGADASLDKPFEFEELERIIKGLL